MHSTERERKRAGENETFEIVLNVMFLNNLASSRHDGQEYKVADEECVLTCQKVTLCFLRGIKRLLSRKKKMEGKLLMPLRLSF